MIQYYGIKKGTKRTRLREIRNKLSNKEKETNKKNFFVCLKLMKKK